MTLELVVTVYSGNITCSGACANRAEGSEDGPRKDWFWAGPLGTACPELLGPNVQEAQPHLRAGASMVPGPTWGLPRQGLLDGPPSGQVWSMAAPLSSPQSVLSVATLLLP